MPQRRIIPGLVPWIVLVAWMALSAGAVFLVEDLGMRWMAVASWFLATMAALRFPLAHLRAKSNPLLNAQGDIPLWLRLVLFGATIASFTGFLAFLATRFG